MISLSLHNNYHRTRSERLAIHGGPQLVVLIGICFFSLFNYPVLAFDAMNQPSFSIWRKGKQIGTAEGERTIQGNGTTLQFTVSMEARILMSLRVKAVTENLFLGNCLAMARYQKIVNGARLNSLSLQQAGNRYMVSEDDATTIIEKHPISFTAICMYFSEPVSVYSLYSEANNCFAPIEHLGNGRYRIVQPDGHLTTYFYQKGQLVRMIAESSYGIIIFQRELKKEGGQI
jgi:hypothetical protein